MGFYRRKSGNFRPFFLPSSSERLLQAFIGTAILGLTTALAQAQDTAAEDRSRCRRYGQAVEVALAADNLAEAKAALARYEAQPRCNPQKQAQLRQQLTQLLPNKKRQEEEQKQAALRQEEGRKQLVAQVHKGIARLVEKYGAVRSYSKREFESWIESRPSTLGAQFFSDVEIEGETLHLWVANQYALGNVSSLSSFAEIADMFIVWCRCDGLTTVGLDMSAIGGGQDSLYALRFNPATGHAAIRSQGSSSLSRAIKEAFTQRESSSTKRTSDGFRDAILGSPFSAFPGLVLAPEDILDFHDEEERRRWKELYAKQKPGEGLFEQPNDDLNIDGGRLDSIRYAFREGKLVGIFLDSTGDANNNASFALLERLYGRLTIEGYCGVTPWDRDIVACLWQQEHIKITTSLKTDKASFSAMLLQPTLEKTDEGTKPKDQKSTSAPQERDALPRAESASPLSPSSVPQPETDTGRHYVQNMISAAMTEGGVNNEEQILEAKRRIEELNRKSRLVRGEQKKAREHNDRGLRHIRHYRG